MSENNFLNVEGKVFPIEIPYPTEFKDSWIQITLLNSNPIIKGVVSLYINDKYPKGTVVYSNFIQNEYPDAFVSFFSNGRVDRVYTAPSQRRNKILSTLGVVGRMLLWNKYKIFLDHSDHSSPAANQTHARAISKIIGETDTEKTKKTEFFKKPDQVWTAEKAPPRNAIFPSIWNGLREYE